MATTLVTRRVYGGTALALLTLVFIALVLIVNYGLRGIRLDLTENNLYTLTPGTKQIVSEIDEPIDLYFFFSREASEQAPPYFKLYADRVRELLEQLVTLSRGKLRLHVIDPQPFSEEEDRAAEFGLSAVPLNAEGDTLYFGLAGTNSTDGRQIIDFFNPRKEQFLEYDVVRLIQQLAKPNKPVVGLLSSLPMTVDFNPMTGQMSEPWAVVSQLEQVATLRTLEPGLTSIANDIDVLVLVHPKNLSRETLYAIDQFVMRGGRALVFVDPQAESDTAGADPRNPFGALGADRSSSLKTLFDAWGIEYDPKKVVVDPEHALVVGMGGGRAPVRHLGILGFGEDSLAKQDVITSALQTINTATAGFVKLRDGSPLTMEPLITSSEQAAVYPVERFAMLTDPTTLNDGLQPGGERRTIAARFTGKLKSAFPDGAPSGSGASNGDNPPSASLEESAEPVSLVVVADTDLLTDPLWVQDESFFGQRYGRVIASNGDFVANAVDNLTGSSALISIRGRASFARPFDRVDELRRQAEDRFRAQERRLDEELKATEQKLAELQKRRGDDSAGLILTPEQEKEIQRFQQQKLRIRKELREVRHGLDQDIDRLGTVLKAINIFLMPLLVCAFAAGVWLWRRRAAAAHSRARTRAAQPAPAVQSAS